MKYQLLIVLLGCTLGLVSASVPTTKNVFDFELYYADKQLHIDGEIFQVDSAFTANRTDANETFDWQAVGLDQLKNFSTFTVEIVRIPASVNDRSNPSDGVRYYLVKQPKLFTVVRFTLFDNAIFQYEFETTLHYTRTLTNIITTLDTMCMAEFEICNVLAYRLMENRL